MRALLLAFILSATQSNAQTQPREQLVTIFVHGVIGLKLSISLYQFVNLLRDSTANTVYQKTIDGVRSIHFSSKTSLLPNSDSKN